MTPDATGPLAFGAVARALQGQRAVGVAVSGGGDSMALLHLAARAGADIGVRVLAVTVDHGLRPESAAEAAMVARFCAARGLEHETLRWNHGAIAGNLPAAARTARYALMADWAKAQGLDSLLLGHTADDQAETFLMRLAREAGIDGLSGMAAQFTRGGVLWQRPLLKMSRAALRDVLRAAGIVWIDDPSNVDPRFDRVKARQAMQALAPMGITPAGLGRVMAQIADARVALDDAVAGAAARLVRQEAGDLCLDWPALDACPDEIIRRIIVAALRWMSGAAYPPRRDDVSHVMRAMARPGQRTLAGCLLRRTGATLRLSREFRAVRDLVTATDALWDNRWRLDGPHSPVLRLRALGEAGLAHCPGWRATGLPRASLIASPAVWDDTRLVAAPLAGLPGGFRAQIVADFIPSLLSH